MDTPVAGQAGPGGATGPAAGRTAAGHADEFWAKALADLAAEEAPTATAADGYLAPGAPIIKPQAFTELEGGWGNLV